ncbi:MAG: hypothetical protein KGH94_04315 [Candidatus Micrarchaeota archaeon]|nr:hypothetical protein [Candidatus Micrarchaeota archaeon]
MVTTEATKARPSIQLFLRSNEIKAVVLKQKIHRFAEMSMEWKEDSLMPLISELPELVNRQTLGRASAENDKAVLHLGFWFNTSLTFAAEKALKTPLATRAGIIQNWMDSRYVLVGLGQDGTILGFNGNGEGERTFSYAVSKALCTMVLDDKKHDKPGDMLDTANINFLEKQGLTLGEELFIGGIKPTTMSFPDGSHRTIHLAAGGIHPNKEYVKGLIRAEPTSDDTLAGAVEMLFGNMVLEYLINPKKPVQPFDEPDYLGILRIMH